MRAPAWDHQLQAGIRAAARLLERGVSLVQEGCSARRVGDQYLVATRAHGGIAHDSASRAAERFLVEAQAETTDREANPHDEHWRHQSVLWAQGLLERYGHVSLDTGSATRVDSGWMWETFTRAGIPTGFGVEETPRAAAEAIIPPVGGER